MGCSPWGRKELGTTERLTLTYLDLNSCSDSEIYSSLGLWECYQHLSAFCICEMATTPTSFIKLCYED